MFHYAILLLPSPTDQLYITRERRKENRNFKIGDMHDSTATAASTIVSFLRFNSKNYFVMREPFA